MRVAWIFWIAGCGFQAHAPLGEQAAPLPDAGFDTARCPASYDVSLLWFDGSPVIGGWSGVEPNDRDGRENQEEQFARIEKTKLYLQDSGGNTRSGALCECVGKPIATAAATAIAGNRPPS